MDQNLQTKTETDEIRLKLVGARLAFVDALFEAKAFKAGDKKSFACKFLLPKDGPLATEVKNAIVKAAQGKWGNDANKILAQLKAENKICLTDGDIKDYDGYAGQYVLSARNKTRPALKAPNGKDNLEEKDGVLYSGCYVIAYVNIWAQDNDWGKRINCGLRGVQFYAPGEAFTGGGVAKNDEFEDVSAQSNTLSAGNADFI